VSVLGLAVPIKNCHQQIAYIPYPKGIGVLRHLYKIANSDRIKEIEGDYQLKYGA